MVETNESIIARQILIEHEIIKQMTRDLESVLLEGGLVWGTTDRDQHLYTTLSAFRTHLQNHFELEETGGFLTEVLSLAPHMNERVDALRQEHELILKDLDDMMRRANPDKPGFKSSYEALGDRILNLLSVISRHEVEENDLIQQVFYQELRAQD